MRKLTLVTSFNGFDMSLGEVKISKLADMKKSKDELVCPKCAKKPYWNGGYDCECGAHYNHWSQLKRVCEGKEVVKEKLDENGVASLSIMSRIEFSKYADACLSEYGLVAVDEKSAKNLKKLLVASKVLNVVIIANFNDTYEKRACVLTTSVSGRIILREIIPVNLAEVRETMTARLDEVSDTDVEEAKQFMKMLPSATESQLKTDDYRAAGVDSTVEIGQVQVLEEILAKAK